MIVTSPKGERPQQKGDHSNNNEQYTMECIFPRSAVPVSATIKLLIPWTSGTSVYQMVVMATGMAAFSLFLLRDVVLMTS